MEIRSDRRYRFEVPPERLWREIAEPSNYRSWWPWLRRFDAEALQPGVRWRCVIQPPLPYTLRVDVDITDVIDGRAVTALVSGDLRGRARIEIVGLDGAGPAREQPSSADAEVDRQHSEARVISTLAPSSRIMGAAAWMVAPVARWGHDWVLATGARQLRAALTDGA